MSIWNFFKKSKGLGYESFENWLNETLNQDIPAEVVAFNFNLYEDTGNAWSMELVGTRTYDADDEDWACDEVFDNRETPLRWQENASWQSITDKVENLIKTYLDQGKYGAKMKTYRAVAVGFVDENLSIVYDK